MSPTVTIDTETLACTAPLGWEDDQGFHFGVRGHSVHGEAN